MLKRTHMENEQTMQNEDCNNGDNSEPTPTRTIQTLKNGKTRFKPVETKHTPELGAIICHLVLMGHPLEEVAKSVGVNRLTIQNWKNEKSPSYLPDFAQKFDIAYRNSTEVLFSYIRIIMNDSSGDMYTDNKTGVSILRPNNANVQRSKLILDKLFRMIRIRQSNIARFGRKTLVINLMHFGKKPKQSDEVIKEANISE